MAISLYIQIIKSGAISASTLCRHVMSAAVKLLGVADPKQHIAHFINTYFDSITFKVMVKISAVNSHCAFLIARLDSKPSCTN